MARPRRILTVEQRIALDRVKRATAQLAIDKQELNAAIRAAGEAGVPVRAVAEVAPFRFQRVSQIMRGE